MKKNGKLESQIIEMLQTLLQVEINLYQCAAEQNISEKKNMYELCKDCICSIKAAVQDKEAYEYKDIQVSCENLLYSLENCRCRFNIDVECQRIEYELLPMTKVVLARFYFFTQIEQGTEEEEVFYKDEAMGLLSNDYINNSVETGHYKYDLSIVVIAYNKLEYTKLCVESLLRNLPEDLKIELILLNHGSTDGTKSYFESVFPTKQIDIKVNGQFSIINLIVEGKYFVSISNDVVVTPNALRLMYDYMETHPETAWAVPSTPNVSNVQTIPAEYSSMEEMEQFAYSNNVDDPYRQEFRVRLCNPLDIRRTSVFLSKKGIRHEIMEVFSKNRFMFPDDKQSIRLRRKGYKMALLKNIYCHHFGSVTLSSENTGTFFSEGRQSFEKTFGVDPWGIGFCYDPVLFYSLKCTGDQHMEVLGINCGLGSNSLKVKEQIKEYSHNRDVTLYNLTKDKRYLEDLAGVSDRSDLYDSIEDLFIKMDSTYDYILVDDKITDYDQDFEIVQKIYKRLKPNGKLIIKIEDKSVCLHEKIVALCEVEKVGDWYILQ